MSLSPGIFGAALLGLVLSAAPAAAQLTVVYPRVAERSEDSYGYRVLRLALEKSGEAFTLRVSPEAMNQDRARRLIDEGLISVLDFGTDAEYEARFDAVYFPIDRGISGYRLLIINSRLAPAFSRVRTLADLKGYVAGQEQGWSDARILEKAGINVAISNEFENLFAMVDKGRFDFFPLGVEEAYGFLEKYRALAPHSEVEGGLVLHYPFARLFFVKKGNLALRDAILKGLKASFADGSFQRLVAKSFAAEVDGSRIAGRRVIEIENRDLTERFLRMPAAYFYSSLEDLVSAIRR